MLLTGLDWALFFLVVLVVFIATWLYSGLLKKNNPVNAYFAYGILFKLIGGGLFAAIFFYVYKVGDTFLYFSGSERLAQYFWEAPALYFKSLFSSPAEIQDAVPGILYDIPYARTDEEWLMVRILSVFQILSFNNYLLLTIWTSLFSFLGSWYIFKLLNAAFTNSTKLAFSCAFLIPSVLFWTSGIIKDSLVFGLIGLSLYKFYRIFLDPSGNKLLNGIMIILSMYVVYNLKSYIVICLVPPLFYAVYTHTRGKIKNKVVQYLAGPALAIVFGGFLFLLTNVLAESSKKYNSDNLEQHAKGFHSWHTATGGSAYNLGEIEYTPLGITRKIPLALTVSFFRPFPWEISSPTMTISAIEGLIALLAFIYLLLYKGFKSLGYIFRNPILSFAIIFSLILGFAAGFTSYNFGALARYKTPFMPFFFFLIFYMADLKWNGKLIFSKQTDNNLKSLGSSSLS